MIAARRHYAVSVVLRDLERSRCAWCARYAPAVIEEDPDELGHVTAELAVCSRPTCRFAAAALGASRSVLIDRWIRRSREARRVGGAR